MNKNDYRTSRDANEKIKKRPIQQPRTGPLNPSPKADRGLLQCAPVASSLGKCLTLPCVYVLGKRGKVMVEKEGGSSGWSWQCKSPPPSSFDGGRVVPNACALRRSILLNAKFVRSFVFFFFFYSAIRH